MTVIVKDVAETSFNDPPKSPMGVLVALTITTSLIVSPFHPFGHRTSKEILVRRFPHLFDLIVQLNLISNSE